MPMFVYRWFLRSLLPERRGHLCRVVRTGQGHATDGRITVEFEDGFRVQCSRVAIKKVKAQGPR